MRFEWDEEKRAANLKKHGFDFADVAQVFENPRDTIIDDRFNYGEIRFFTIGLVNGRVVAISHTETEDVIRIILARKADRNEQTKYFKEIADRLGEN